MNPLVLLLFIGGASAAAVGGYVAYDHYIVDSAQKPAPVATAEPTGTPKEQEPAVEASKAPTETKEEVEVAAVDPQPEETPPEVEVTEPKAEAPVPEVPVIKQPEVVVVPSFDVVRIEKTGDAVIAGQAAPNSTVNLVNNGEIIAQTKADETGAFVIIPDQPFSGESNEIWLSAVKEEDKQIQSNQIVAIAVDGQKTPLVVLVEEGKPASVLQVPEAEETVVVEAPVETEVKEKVEVAQETQPTEPAEDVVAETESEPAETVVAAVEPEAEVVPTPTPEPVAEPVVQTEETAPEGEVVTEAANETPTTATTNAEPVEETQVASIPATEPEPTPEPSAPATLVQPTGNVSVDAVETEKDKIFIAGTSSPGKTVRVYVEDELVGDAKTNNEGRWLLEDEKELEPGDYNIRADELKSSGRVDSRAEVPFSVSETNEVRLKPLDPAQGRRVIIRRNDNLWTISRRLYGNGQRFTAIYTQNKEQIRNPNLIFPGQVFELPDEALAPLQGPAGPDNRG